MKVIVEMPFLFVGIVWHQDVGEFQPCIVYANGNPFWEMSATCETYFEFCFKNLNVSNSFT